MENKIIRTKFNKEGDMIYISHLDLQNFYKEPLEELK